MQLIDHDTLGMAELVELYDSVGWSTYTAQPRDLFEGVRRSTYWVTARDGIRLVGLARCVSDDYSIMYLQDILVRPDHQGQGVGSQLIQKCLSRFDHVRQQVLLTDDEPAQHALYRSAGFADVAGLKNNALHAFVSMKGVELS
ncbi:GNAT family N-acetyltransferase [Ornithinimicrobium sp. INDO-MA30-4]|uniref:GNAT family N-acetyltransferase n=1 Tax=Ornithinimicrobium sp. INDO-MA30-4 TaxID=2908651 RepID=UPI001F420124|nr:GNAT family N-acetyltransferase [Ornithinimicrobium sp. INDO-MA30-4]UJH71026.1 GNAT family N-acetyltransferase [Ornithinimicrobium sp. INDO-MA30-4]